MGRKRRLAKKRIFRIKEDRGAAHPTLGPRLSLGKQQNGQIDHVAQGAQGGCETGGPQEGGEYKTEGA